MSVTSFIHVNKAENHDFELEKFSREIERKYPGTGIELSKTASFFYDICWENYAETYQFTLRMDKKKNHLCHRVF